MHSEGQGFVEAMSNVRNFFKWDQVSKPSSPKEIISSLTPNFIKDWRTKLGGVFNVGSRVKGWLKGGGSSSVSHGRH